MTTQNQQGFTAVELVITIIVGVMFFLTAGQIYSVVLSDSANARNKANAAAIAYAEARILLAGISDTCVANASLGIQPSASYPPAPSVASLPSPASISAAVACPFSGASYLANTAVSRLTVTVTYGPKAEKVKHVLYQY